MSATKVINWLKTQLVKIKEFFDDCNLDCDEFILAFYQNDQDIK